MVNDISMIPSHQLENQPEHWSLVSSIFERGTQAAEMNWKSDD